MEVDFVNAQGQDNCGLLFDQGGEAVREAPGDAAGEELEKPLAESIIVEGVKECCVGADGEKDCAESKPHSVPDAKEPDSSPTKKPICEKEQLEVSREGADVHAVKIKVQDSEEAREEAACRGKSLHGEKNELPQLGEANVEWRSTIAGRNTNQRRRLTPNRQGEAERINQLYRNSKSTNINLYKRMYQSYLLLRKEQNELLAQNRRKEERNMKLKYELDSLRGNSYYANFFFNNDSDNLFGDLASGISNIWKWMDMEGKSAHVKNAQKGEVGPTTQVHHSGGVSPPRGGDPQAGYEATTEAVHKGECANAQNDVPAEGSAAGGTSCQGVVAPSEDRPDEHSQEYEPAKDTPPNGVQLSEVQPAGSCPMENEDRTNTISEARMESPSRINETKVTRMMEGIPSHGKNTQQAATTHNGGQKKRVHFVKGVYKHLQRNDANEVNLPPSHNSSLQNEKIENKNSFLWEKESRPVKRGCVKYGQLQNRFTDQERSSLRVDREPGAFTSMECPKDNIINYIKGRLSVGGRTHGKAAVASGQKPAMSVQRTWMRHSGGPNKRIIKEEEKLLFHICNCKENKYVPLNVGSFFMVPPKRAVPDEDFSLRCLEKCMDFILRRKERGNHSEIRVRQKRSSNVPCESVPLASATTNMRDVNEQEGGVPRQGEAGVGEEGDEKESPPVGQSNREEGRKKTRLITQQVTLREGDKNGGLEEGAEKQLLRRGQSGRKGLLQVNRKGRSNEGRTVQKCQVKGKKGTKYNTQKMDMGPGSKFGHLMTRKGFTRMRDSWGRLICEVVSKREEKRGGIFSPVVKVRKTVKWAPHTKGHSRHVRFSRIGRRFSPSIRRSRCARSGFEEVSKGGEKKTHGGQNKSSKSSRSLVDKCVSEGKVDEGGVTIGREDNVVGRDSPEGHAAGSFKWNAISTEQHSASLGPPPDTAPHGCLQREKNSSANSNLLKEALETYVKSLDLSTRRIDCIEEENTDSVTIIGIQIKVRDEYIYLNLDALSTVEDSVRVWVEQNDKVLNGFVTSSELICSTLKYYCVDIFTFVCIFLEALENHIEEFPFYLSISLEDIFRKGADADDADDVDDADDADDADDVDDACTVHP
ncbi:hypothetical protein AK88_01070 [Plasmodium fragile]|uniref:Uncharacterized protein n=1 Tax=Plasmodium fragile TaxID=5857 RepID=A0A0D9QQZ0_PLAFR|nr:uncharacterized protein AK88_01070 [Plasmodium fragile]KJP89192.1 hypothetical protein AK88_01070 [Plasmodium fragile]